MKIQNLFLILCCSVGFVFVYDLSACGVGCHRIFVLGIFEWLKLAQPDTISSDFLNIASFPF